MQEFFEVASLEQALSHAAGFEPVAAESVPLAEACGRVLAEDLRADVDVPDFRRSTMDGFAVAASSTFGASESSPAQLRVLGAVAMGERPALRVGPGEAVRILTGGMLPAGADAVVMVEHAEVVDGTTVEAYRSVAPGQHVVAPGDDARAGELLLRRGRRLRPQEVGLLAALGHGRVAVFARPIVAILSTGDEVVAVEAAPSPGQIRDVNSYTLGAAVEQGGGRAVLYGIVPDELSALREAAAQAVAEADLVLISGGSSVGARDFTLDVITALPQSQLLLHGLSIKPGKPTVLARVGERPLFGLPGHVTSAMVVYRVIVSAFLDRLAGVEPTGQPLRRLPARLTRNVASVHGRVDYLRVALSERHGQLQAEPILGASGLLRTMVAAEGLVEIGLNVEGLDAGADVWVLPL